MADEKKNPLDGISVLTPWEMVNGDLHTELQREVSPGHLLFGISARAVARRIDNDDVLFAVEGAAAPFALVHLTWKREFSPDWPATEFYESLDAWVEKRMKRDNWERTKQDVLRIPAQVDPAWSGAEDTWDDQ